MFTDFSEEADRSLSLGDVLDIKANIWLVVITFLGTQTAYFLSKNDLTPLVHHGQVLSAILLVIAGAITLIELCPRKYWINEPSKDKALEERVVELRNHYATYENCEDLVLAQLVKDRAEWAKERTAKNQRINRQKSALISWSFWLTACGAAINLLTLLHFIKLPL